MNHSIGYEMRLQTARVLRKEEQERVRALAVSKRLREEAFDALQRALNTIERLPVLLVAYEATGDHDHSTSGTRPLAVGAPCPGGDCNVARARRIIDALRNQLILP
jgi:hypothetical protein